MVNTKQISESNVVKKGKSGKGSKDKISKGKNNTTQATLTQPIYNFVSQQQQLMYPCYMQPFPVYNS